MVLDLPRFNRSGVLFKLEATAFCEDVKIQTGLIIVGVWIALSFTLGPVLAWAFFYSERRAKAAEVALDRQIAAHPAVPLASVLLTDAADTRRQTRVIQAHDAQ
jgi:hypothetical protein